MKLWEVYGIDVPVLRIEARSFDEAIAKARKQHSSYCMARVIDLIHK